MPQTRPFDTRPGQAAPSTSDVTIDAVVYKRCSATGRLFVGVADAQRSWLYDATPTTPNYIMPMTDRQLVEILNCWPEALSGKAGGSVYRRHNAAGQVI